ncbi:hypothetical protein VTI74DRAFT_5270 [Chaetomium olivicolor]
MEDVDANQPTSQAQINEQACKSTTYIIPTSTRSAGTLSVNRSSQAAHVFTKLQMYEPYYQQIRTHTELSLSLIHGMNAIMSQERHCRARQPFLMYQSRFCLRQPSRR